MKSICRYCNYPIIVHPPGVWEHITGWIACRHHLREIGEPSEAWNINGSAAPVSDNDIIDLLLEKYGD